MASRPATSTGPGVPRHQRRVRAATRPTSARFRAGGLALGAFNRWFLTYTFRTCLPDPDHLAVLAGPVVVGVAVHPHRRLAGRAAPSFTSPLRRAGRGVLSPPHGHTAPRGARYRSATARWGDHAETSGARDHRRPAPVRPTSCSQGAWRGGRRPRSRGGASALRPALWAIWMPWSSSSSAWILGTP